MGVDSCTEPRTLLHMDFIGTHTEYTRSLVVHEVQDKALRVTEALYRTTNLFSDTEPLKWSLRESAVKILNAVSGFDHNATYEQSRELEQLESLLKGLFLKFDLAASGTFIARRNFDVLRQEYLSLRDDIAKNKNGESCFYLEGFPIKPNQKTLSDKSEDNGQSLEISKNGPLQGEAKSAEHAKVVQRERSVENERGGGAGAVGAPERQKTLLGFIKSKGPSSVGDLARLLGASISEKTVQRELTKMAENGLLKREGEKRWRRYSV